MDNQRNTSFLVPAKPFLDYSDLLSRLSDRGMEVDNSDHALNKLAQIGYYRLSGFWYPARVIKNQKREEQFLDNTRFSEIVKLYIFDKKLRLSFTDALERIEIHIRSIIAHELGRIEPLSYEKKKFFNKRFFSPPKGKEKEQSHYDKWQRRHSNELKKSFEESICWHRKKGMKMPIWVVIEAWDFGLLSNFYRMLKFSYQKKICSRLDIDDPKVLEQWLQAFNILRNRCAHHSRIWNRSLSLTLKVAEESLYFRELELEQHSRERLYGAITTVWYLLRNINPRSEWLDKMSDIIDEMPQVPGCPKSAMGLPKEGLQLDILLG